MEKDNKNLSVLAWTGSKKKLAPVIVPLLSSLINDDTVYVEPFLGAGNIAFTLQPEKAILSDYNEDLIVFYTVVRDNPHDLYHLASEYCSKDSLDFYLSIRSRDREDTFHQLSPLERAARFFYLNKAAYNSLYRVNKSGFHNAHWGGNIKKTVLPSLDTLLQLSNYLSQPGVIIQWCSYEETLKNVEYSYKNNNVLIYCDPPYDESFTRYTAQGFGKKDQEHLSYTVQKIKKDNPSYHMFLSNSNTDFIRNLYKDSHIDEITTKYTMAQTGLYENTRELFITL